MKHVILVGLGNYGLLKTATDSLRQLDYIYILILIRKKWRNSLMNAKAYNIFSTAVSDHRIVCQDQNELEGLQKYH